MEMRIQMASPNPVRLYLNNKTKFAYFGIMPQPKSDTSHLRRASVSLPVPPQRIQMVGMKWMKSRVEPEVCTVKNSLRSF